MIIALMPGIPVVAAIPKLKKFIGRFTFVYIFNPISIAMLNIDEDNVDKTERFE